MVQGLDTHTNKLSIFQIERCSQKHTCLYLEGKFSKWYVSFSTGLSGNHFNVRNWSLFDENNLPVCYVILQIDSIHDVHIYATQKAKQKKKPKLSMIFFSDERLINCLVKARWYLFDKYNLLHYLKLEAITFFTVYSRAYFFK